MRPYTTLSDHLRERFGVRVQKVPLDAGAGCPNRDGTLSRSGCLFCSPRGSGTGAAAKGISLADQWAELAPRIVARYGARSGSTDKRIRLMAYLQAFTNTHGPVERLARVLEETAGLDGAAGLSIGTRPDCCEDHKLNLLAGLRDRGFDPVFLELGLQSSNDDTLRRINRGHDAACLADAAKRAAAKGLEVVVHVMAGLPGEGLDELLATMDFINDLPVAGIKLHNTYVCKGTGLERLWRSGEYVPPTLEQYADWAAQALVRLRRDIIVHRVTGDPAPDELAAPNWAGDKQRVLAALEASVETALTRTAKT